jgi:hypothetical protein
MFLWSGMALYVTTAWLVRAQRDESRMNESPAAALAGPHRAAATAGSFADLTALEG